MPFQFGTNWSRYSDMTADIVAPLMAYEGLTAFFLEAAFLGVLLFGRKRVPQWAHFCRGDHGGARHAPVHVLDSRRQQLDADADRLHDRDGRFFPDDWLAVIFNPSFPYRFAHTVIGGLPHDRVHRHRRGGVSPAQRQVRGREQGHDRDGRGPRRRCWCRCRR